jgi:3'-5' exoribonuclease
MKINQLKQAVTSGESVQVVGKINTINESTTRDGQPFISVNVEDASGTVTARLWNTREHTFEKGGVYQIDGTVSEYNSRLQLIVASYEPITDPVVVQSFYAHAPIGKEALLERVKYYHSMIVDPEYHQMVTAIFKDHLAAFLEYPAATQNHHAYLQGLSYHTVSMCQLAERIMPLYPMFDASLVYAGILLHDIAKVAELSDAKAPEYTTPGKLIGHLVLGAQWVQTAARALGVEDTKSMLLQHLLISHHGRKEWGSAQVPQTAEAELLFFIDNLDSKMESIRVALDETELTEWTKRIPVLDGRSLWHHYKNPKA